MIGESVMDLNTILIILGIIALLALVAHGIWSNRREKSQYFQNANTFSQNHQPNRFTAPNQAARPSAELPIANKPVHSFVEEKLAFLVYTFATRFYSFGGLRKYKEKFSPSSCASFERTAKSSESKYEKSISSPG